MRTDLRNIGVIAQKEFSDHLYSPSFRMLLGIFTLTILSMSVISGKEGCELFNQGFGFIDVAQVITLFIPILGLALGPVTKSNFTMKSNSTAFLNPKNRNENQSNITGMPENAGTAGKQERESIPAQAAKGAPFISQVWVIVVILVVVVGRKMK